jgi:hypothetical protein
MNIRKSLAVTSLAIGLLLAGRSAEAAIYPDFTFDQTLISNCATQVVVPGMPCAFVADKMAGAYTEVLTVQSVTGPGAGTFSTVAYFNVATFTINDDANTAVGFPPSMLNLEAPPALDGYDIFAVFGATGSFSTDVTGTVNFVATSGCVELYADLDNDSGIPPGALPAAAPAVPVCDGPPSGAPGGVGDGLGMNFSVAAAADDALLATATLSQGEGHGDPADPDSGDFSIQFNPFVLTVLGAGVFVAPVPFYMTAQIEGVFNAFTPGGPGTSTIVGGAGNVFFVPEPASLALLGIGLLGSAVAMRRRQRAAK